MPNADPQKAEAVALLPIEAWLVIFNGKAKRVSLEPMKDGEILGSDIHAQPVTITLGHTPQPPVGLRERLVKLRAEMLESDVDGRYVNEVEDMVDGYPPTEPRP